MKYLKLFYRWWADLGKPDKGENVYGFSVFVSTLILLWLTWLPIHFHVWYLCVFLIGEYKEDFEYWRALLRQNN